MMKKILMSVYAACAMLVIAGSLLWFVFTLHSDATAGKTTALNNFKVFAQHTGEIVSEAAQETDLARLQPRLEQLSRNYEKYVQAVVVKDSTGIVFIWPKDTDIFSYTGQYTVEVKNLPLFFTAAQTHIPIKETGNTVTVHAALRTLPIETIFTRGQIVFFMLLFIVLMTVIVLVVSYMDLKPAVKKPVVKDNEYTPKTDAAASNIMQPDTVQSDEHLADQTVRCYDETSQTLTTPSKTDTSNTVQNKPQASYDTPVDSREESAAKEHAIKEDTADSPLPLHEQLESLNRLHIYDDERSQQTQPEYQEHSEYPALEDNMPEEKDGTDTDRQVSSNTAESGIPKTADTPKADIKQELGAENYGSFENHTQPSKTETEAKETAKQRSVTSFENTPLSDAARSNGHSLEQATLIEELTTAITETAVAEEDLTLMLIHATDIPHNQQIIHLLRSTLDRIHKVFVFNKNILGVIIFYAPLDQAMQIASNLYDEIHTRLDDSAKKSLGIGLTTRAGRLIPAHRMIEEATAAIGKATQEDSDPIVAFRVNPDKYRRCIARLS